MKTSGHLILYITENEDFELWKVLTQISPEERTAFVKNALKKAILQNSQSHHDTTKVNKSFSPERTYTEPFINEQVLEESYYPKNVAIEEQVEHQTEDETNQLQFDELFLSSVLTDKSSIPGLDFLLNNVIGEEDDEIVIEFIKNKAR